MWASVQRDGRPAEYGCRRVLNALFPSVDAHSLQYVRAAREPPSVSLAGYRQFQSTSYDAALCLAWVA